MTKKAKISFLILIWGIVAIQIGVNYKEREKLNSMVTAFSIAEGTSSEKVVEAYGYFGEMELSNTNKKEMLENLLKRLDIEGDYYWSQAEEESYERVILECDTDKEKVMLQFITMIQTEREPEQYIAIKIESEQKTEEFVALYERVKNLYEEIEVDATVYLEVEQEKRGKLMKAGANQVVKEIFSILDAKEVRRVTTNDIYTVYGYTLKEDNYLILDNERVNVSVAMYYDERMEKTYIKIGLPIIHSSY